MGVSKGLVVRIDVRAWSGAGGALEPKVGSSLAEHVIEHGRDADRIELNFADVGTVSSAFANAFLLRLAATAPLEEWRKRLDFKALGPRQADVIAKSIRAARNTPLGEASVGVMSSSQEPRTLAGWGEDSLSLFMQAANERMLQTFAHLRGSWAHLAAIDEAYLKVAETLGQTPDWLEAAFLVRAHSAFRAGVRLAGSGQVPESYMVLRGSLEWALYAHYLAGNPERERRWLSRADTADTRKKGRNEFSVGAVLRRLAAQSSRVGSLARDLYEHLSEYGAHPNDLALAASSTLEKGANDHQLKTAYIAPDGLPARLALKTGARVGVCNLWIFRFVFSERFDILGITDELHRLGEGL